MPLLSIPQSKCKRLCFTPKNTKIHGFILKIFLFFLLFLFISSIGSSLSHNRSFFFTLFSYNFQMGRVIVSFLSASHIPSFYYYKSLVISISYLIPIVEGLVLLLLSIRFQGTAQVYYSFFHSILNFPTNNGDESGNSASIPCQLYIPSIAQRSLAQELLSSFGLGFSIVYRAFPIV